MKPIKRAPAIIASLLGALAIALPITLMAKRSGRKGAHGLSGGGDGGWNGGIGKLHADGRWKWQWKLAWW